MDLFHLFNLKDSQKITKSVTPAKAGVQNLFKRLDSGFRRNDDKSEFQTFYETINIAGVCNS